MTFHKVNELSPAVQMLVASKGNICKQYDRKLFLNDGQTVEFTSYNASGSGSFCFDDGSQLWSSQLTSRIVIMNKGKVSRIGRCRIILKEKEEIEFGESSLGRIWSIVQGKRYRVESVQGFRLTGRLAFASDSNVVSEIEKAYSENAISRIDGCIKSAKTYTFIEI